MANNEKKYTPQDSRVINRKLRGDWFFPSNRFFLQRISEAKEFKDGEVTDKIIGYTYRCVELDNYERVNVKIESDMPLMTDEELQEIRQTGQKVFVSFENLTLTPYINSNTGSVSDSIKATGVHEVEE